MSVEESRAFLDRLEAHCLQPQVKTVLLGGPFQRKNASFCQDRLGTNIGKELRKSTGWFSDI